MFCIFITEIILYYVSIRSYLEIQAQHALGSPENTPQATELCIMHRL